MKLTSAMIRQLFDEQLGTWPLARDNFDALKRVRSKSFTVGGCTIRVQFNPARIRSTAARVDTKSLQDRPCFLCADRLPAEQRGLPFGRDYRVLVNPYPIFPLHFTVPCTAHTDQRIAGRYGDMLELAETLEGFTVFYNGPQCGASAPDHMHFQAGNRGFLPIEREVAAGERRAVIDCPGGQVYTLRHDPRRVLVIESEQREWAEQTFDRLYALLDRREGEAEPMLNIVTWYEGSHWYSCLFPRERHRPRCFYAEGEDNILLSPASVDLGGVFITPQEKDFDKITARDIETIIREICISEEKMEKTIRQLTMNQSLIVNHKND